MNQSPAIWKISTAIVALLGLDFGTKQWAKAVLQGQEGKSYLWDTCRLIYVENTGAFLSLGAGWSDAVSFWVFSILPLVALLALLAYIFKMRSTQTFTQMIPWVFVFVGGMGNVIDRLLYNRHVTDFMNVGIGSLRTGIFNVADMYIMAGLGWMLYTMMTEKKAAEAVSE